MKVGDKLYCIKDLIGHDVGGCYAILSTGKYYRIDRIVNDNTLFYIHSPETDTILSYHIDHLLTYFITEKELRKKKLKKIYPI